MRLPYIVGVFEKFFNFIQYIVWHFEFRTFYELLIYALKLRQPLH